MFDPDVPGSVPDDPSPVPLERLEAQICELAGHLAAATCRFLVLLADFDARRGWASWDMRSCAAWLSWKCQLTSGTAREHVRVARALRGLPVIREQFEAGRLSYAKVRALTRIATPQTEAGLAEIAGPMTGNQLERFARAHRQVSHAGDTSARIRRRSAAPPCCPGWRTTATAPSSRSAAAAGGPAPRSAARPGSGTSAGAGSRAVSPAGSTCTTSCTGATVAAPTWTT
jgi:hypothetical protein